MFQPEASSFPYPFWSSSERATSSCHSLAAPSYLRLPCPTSWLGQSCAATATTLLIAQAGPWCGFWCDPATSSRRTVACFASICDVSTDVPDAVSANMTQNSSPCSSGKRSLKFVAHVPKTQEGTCFSSSARSASLRSKNILAGNRLCADARSKW